jgi:hypothetical protein
MLQMNLNAARRCKSQGFLQKLHICKEQEKSATSALTVLAHVTQVGFGFSELALRLTQPYIAWPRAGLSVELQH